MQKIINVLSIASFVISASIAGTGIYVYANKAAAGAVLKNLPTPSLPSSTGLAIPPF